MPLSETPKGDARLLSSSDKESNPRSDYERERDKRRRQDALTCLVETGRAKTAEEAEHYLESLNRLKHAFIGLLRELPTDTTTSDFFEHEGAGSVLLGSAFSRRTLATLPLLEQLNSKEIDETNPRLWELQRTIDSHADAFSHRENILITMVSGGNLAITGKLAGYLRERLTQEDITFLKCEYTYSRQDLVRNLTKAATEVASSNEYMDYDWRTALPE